MTDNKNIIKGNRHVGIKPIKKRSFYAIIDVKTKTNKGFVTESVMYTHFGSRLESKNELYRIAKNLKGDIFYFGAFKN